LKKKFFGEYFQNLKRSNIVKIDFIYMPHTKEYIKTLNSTIIPISQPLMLATELSNNYLLINKGFWFAT
jgi:hypothetical protein